MKKFLLYSFSLLFLMSSFNLEAQRKKKKVEKTTLTPIFVKVDTLKVEKELPIPIDTLSTELANLIGLIDH